MTRSLFGKLFATTALIVSMGFVILVVATTFMSNVIWKKEKIAILERNANTITDTFCEIKSSGYMAELNRIGNSVANSSNTTVFFVDKDGSVFSSSKNNENVSPIITVSSTIMKQLIKNGSYSENGTLNGIYPKQYYTYAKTLVDSSGIYGAVFISGPADDVQSLTTSMMNMSLITSACVLIILFVIIYCYVRSMFAPLRSMSDAAKAMANGDFSKRVDENRNDEIGELAKSFNAMSASLESLETMRSSFVANVSHELKTPMTTIGGFIEGILDGTIPKEKQNKYLTVVADEIKRLSTLVNSMLSLSKLDSNQAELKCSKVDIVDIICKVVISFERQLESKNIEFIGMDDFKRVIIECDGDMIYQVIYNLFDNAVKFTPEGGYISIFVSEYNSSIKIYIKNSGVGIPAEEIQHVFERFYKTDKSRSVDKTGVGLGLYIVKNILHYHNGSVSVKSVEGMYTQFTVSLPKIHE